MRSRFNYLIAGLALAAATIGPAGAAPATLTSDAELRSDRYVDATTIARVKRGTAVNTIKSEAGWVQVQVGTQVGWLRASFLSSPGAEMAGVATLDGGRSAPGNILATSGVRSIPRSSRHALIIGIGEYMDSAVPALNGVRYDMESAGKMAGAMSIPQGNTTVLRDREATAARIEKEIAALNERMQPGDRVFIYFSGHGTRSRVAEASREVCVEALMAADSRPLTNQKLAALLQPIADKTDKLMVFYDACHSGGVIAQSSTRSVSMGKAVLKAKFAAQGSSDFCSVPTNVRTRGLTKEVQPYGGGLQNFVHVSSSRPDEVSFDDASAGGVATQAWRDCMLGEARDLDASGGVTVEEIAACAQVKMDARFANNANFSVPHLTLGGNRGFVPALFAGSNPQAAVPDGPALPPPSAALLDIFAQRDARRLVDLKAKSAELKIGQDPLELDITSSHAGYLYLVLLGSDNKSYYLLYPNDFDRNNEIQAGQTIRLPRKNWAITAQGPAGTDRLLAVVTESPRDLSLLGKDKTGPFVHTLTDGNGRANLQWLMGSSENLGTADCASGAGRRNLSVVRKCSDAYGAAMLDIVERQ